MSAHNRRDGKARAVLLVAVLTGIFLLVVPFLLTPPATLEIVLRDLVFQSNLQGKTVRVRRGDRRGAALSAPIQQARPEGFLAQVGRIDSGSSSFLVEVAGYRPAPVSIEAAPLQIVRAPVSLVPTFGRLKVTTVSARDANDEVLAIMKVGKTQISTTPQSTALIDLLPGRYRLSGEAQGYCGGEREVTIAEGRTTEVKLALSPDPATPELARIVLDWGENPRDLDAHLSDSDAADPTGIGHVYYAHKKGFTRQRNLFAELDVDYQHSEGFETITVYGDSDGSYEYYVDLYAGEGTLGASGAKVDIVTHGCHHRRYSVPPQCDKDIWTVANLRITGGRLEIVDRQGCADGVPFRARRKVDGSPVS